MRGILFAVLWMLLPIEAQSQEDLQPRFRAYPSGIGAALGQGWNSALDLPTGAVCVVFRAQSDPHQDRSLALSRVLDSESLTINLSQDVKAKVKATFGGGGSASIDASHRYSSETKTNLSATNVVANATVINGLRFTVPDSTGSLRLTGTARNLLVGDSAVFRHACGDGFVSGIVSGARLAAQISTTTSTFEQRTELERSLDTKATLFGGAANAEAGLSETLKTFATAARDEFRVDVFQEGGSGGALAVDTASLRTAIQALPEQARTAPKPLQLTVTPYSALPDWPGGVARPLEDAFLAALARYYLRIEGLLTELIDVEEDAYRYEGDDYLHAAYLAATTDTLAALRDSLLLELEWAGRLLVDPDSIGDCVAPQRRPDSFNGHLGRRPVPGCGSIDHERLNDLRFAVRLPIPRHAVPTDMLPALQLEADGTLDDNGKATLAWQTYWYRIFRTMTARCRELGECAPRSDYAEQFRKLDGAFGGILTSGEEGAVRRTADGSSVEVCGTNGWVAGLDPDLEATARSLPFSLTVVSCQ